MEDGAEIDWPSLCFHESFLLGRTRAARRVLKFQHVFIFGLGRIGSGSLGIRGDAAVHEAGS